MSSSNGFVETTGADCERSAIGEEVFTEFVSAVVVGVVVFEFISSFEVVRVGGCF
jgi:hypothetical protein